MTAIDEIQSLKDKNGQIFTTEKLSRTDAIKYFCVQCLGFEGHPDDCEIETCPLFHFRGKVMLGRLSDEQRQKLSDNAKRHGFKKLDKTKA
jgi:hypothetical protein